MYNLYNLEANFYPESLLLSFRQFLSAEKVSKGTVRSYISDTRFFFNWFVSFLSTNKILEANSHPVHDVASLLQLINPKILQSYETYLRNNQIPLKTTNRRFSALRKLGSFCLSQRLIAENIFETLKTLTESSPLPENDYHLEEFRTFLWQDGATKATIKNYLGDVRQFLVWNKKDSH